MIHLITTRVTPHELQDMLQVFGDFIKLAVDVERGILAGGGALHADCEAVLLEYGSNNDEVWGADWYPLTQQLGYEAMLNLRPRLGNRSMYLQNRFLRDKIEHIADELLKGVFP